MTATTRTRFVRSSVIGTAIGFCPFLWALTAGRATLLRPARPDHLFSNVFDLQALALLHGHFDVAPGSLAIESFIVGGRTYTYFPPFPALLRMPILAVAPGLTGQLTALSILFAWLVLMVATAWLLWLTRGLLRPGRLFGRLECTAVGAFLASVGGGSIIVYLAAAPWVYHEVYAWSAALTVLTSVCALRYLDDPSPRRAVDFGVALTALILTRTTMGVGGVVMALICAGLLHSRGKKSLRSHTGWLGAIIAAGTAVLAACLVTWIKFGSPFRFLPLEAQVWTQVNEHRRVTLAANGGGLTNIRFMPSTINAYFNPLGVRFVPYFPYVTLPSEPPRVYAGATFDQTYRTGSVTAFMPLFVGLTAVSGVSIVRRLLVRRSMPPVWVPVVGTAVGMLGILNYGYLAHRYSGDILPLLIVGSCVGLVSLFGAQHLTRRAVAAPIALLAAWGILANGAIAWALIGRTEGATTLRQFVGRQLSLPNDSSFDKGLKEVPSLPANGPTDSIVVVGKCQAIFTATGETNEPWQPLGGQTNRALLSLPARPTTTPLATFSGRSANELVLSLEFDGRGDVRVVTTGLYERLGRWMALPGRGPFLLRVGPDLGLTSWGVTIDDELVGLVEITRYDRTWTQRYLVPEPILSSPFLLWLPPELDRLCERIAARAMR